MEAQEFNPYQGPETHGTPYPVTDAEFLISPALIHVVSKTKGWVRFLSVMMFISGIFSLFFGIAIFAVPDVGAAALSDMQDFPGGAIAFGGMYALSGLIYILFGAKLWGMANRYRDLMHAPKGTNLLSALRAQRVYWRLFGIVLITGLLLYIAFFGFAIALSL